MSEKSRRGSLGSVVVSVCCLSAYAVADGTEELGPPSIGIGSGTGMVLAGTGLAGGQPGAVRITVPTDATVVQVLAYWEGMARWVWEHGDTDTISIAGQTVVGQRIGGVTHIINQNYSSTYRADVTSLGLVAPGDNTLAVEGLDFQSQSDGLGVVVIYDDGGQAAEIGVRDGSDYALEGFLVPLDDTVLQTFEVEPHEQDREVELSIMVGHVSDQLSTVVEVWVDDVLTSQLLDVLGDPAQPQWDTLTHRLTVPAGASRIGIRPASRDSVLGPRAPSPGSPLVWVFAGMALEPPDEPERNGDEGCGPWVWALAPHLWDGGMESLTTDIHTWTRFNAFLGVPRRRTGLGNRASLMDALWCRGRSFRWQRVLNRQTVAALVNADSGLDFTYTVDEVTSMYRDAVGVDPGPETIKGLICKLAWANWWKKECPLR